MSDRSPGRTLVDTDLPALIAAIELSHEVGRWQSVCDLAERLVVDLGVRSLWAEWEYTHQLALDAALRSGDERLQAEVLRNVARLHADRGDLRQAIHHTNRSIELYRASGDAQWTMVSCWVLADAHRVLCEWPEAWAAIEEGESLLRLLDEPTWEAVFVRTRGEIHRDRWEWAPAVHHLGESLDRFRRLEETSWVAYTLFSLAIALDGAGRGDEAVPLLRESVATFRRLENGRAEHYARQTFAGVHLTAGRLDRAQIHLDACLDEFRRIGDRVWEAQTLSAYGRLYLRRGDVGNSLVAYEAALDILRTEGDRRLRPRTMVGRAAALAAADRPDDAALLWAKARQLLAELDLPDADHPPPWERKDEDR
ncbi:MAG: tetratricopeptide repeat protein [Actinomycetota bacterium]